MIVAEPFSFQKTNDSQDLTDAPSRYARSLKPSMTLEFLRQSPVCQLPVLKKIFARQADVLSSRIRLIQKRCNSITHGHQILRVFPGREANHTGCFYQVIDDYDEHDGQAELQQILLINFFHETIIDRVSSYRQVLSMICSLFNIAVSFILMIFAEPKIELLDRILASVRPNV